MFLLQIQNGDPKSISNVPPSPPNRPFLQALIYVYIISLLKLPFVAKTFAFKPKIAAVISLTVVLPTLPVMAIVFGATCIFTALPSKPSAMRVSSTINCTTLLSLSSSLSTSFSTITVS